MLESNNNDNNPTNSTKQAISGTLDEVKVISLMHDTISRIFIKAT